jgi:hypothetical protein
MKELRIEWNGIKLKLAIWEMGMMKTRRLVNRFANDVAVL